MEWHKKKINTKLLLKVILVILCLYTLFFLFKNLYSSAFFQKRDRVNVLFYGKETLLYSIGLVDSVDYVLSLPADLETIIPGGYGYYRVGALGRLVDLEKKPDLFRKSFSLLSLSFIDFYFYPSANRQMNRGAEIYFGEGLIDTGVPSITSLFLSQTNAHFFDRIYLFFRFFAKTKSQFKEISKIPTEKRADIAAFSIEKFFESSQGYFYKKSYRNEKRVVQILYTKSYETVQAISNILEGEGIRVADLSQIDKTEKGCIVWEKESVGSLTARGIATFLGCKMTKGITSPYDIIVILGEKEGEWEVD
ncbi:hypothetical protein HYW87_02485 [Candidatus Roizmanbacteria bacterium]|nr:hypothetical protein [Candidatus Roizmanbacteria bacterium]